jgi:hypothetical protein
MREPLQALTLRQIEMSREAYGRIQGLVVGAAKSTASKSVQRRPEAAADTEPRNV